MTHTKKTLSYQQSGVNIKQADILINKIKDLSKHTANQQHVISGVGGFGGLFELPSGYKNPVLVSGTDGVGTKLKLAIALNQHHTIGIDLVAMCVNDIITSGAKPLFFLDYYASSKLRLNRDEAIMEGIVKGCQMAHMTLLGGETAEVPGLYQKNDYDLAGFCVGIVEKEAIINQHHICHGDRLIAMASSGIHSNGYALIHEIIRINQLSPSNIILQDVQLDKLLITPTKIYVDAAQQLCHDFDIHGLAHITGGGLINNVPRMLPNYTHAIINPHSWEWPSVFKWLQEQGNVTTEEMQRTFNLGIGMIACLNPEQAPEAIKQLKKLGEHCWDMGYIESCSEKTPIAKIK